MSVNLSAFFNGTKPSGNETNLLQNVNQALEQLTNSNTATNINTSSINSPVNILNGQTFQALIKSINNNNVVIKLTDGSELSAVLKSDINLKVGQNITFLADTNNNTVFLKPLSSLDQQLMMSETALEAAHLPATQQNKNIVDALLNQNMSLSSDTINNFVRLTAKYPDCNVNTLIQLTKLNIPITQNNIDQLNAYKNYENSILKQMNEIPTQLNEYVAKLLPDSEKNMPDTLNHIINVLYDTNNASADSNQSLPSTPAINVLSSDELKHLNSLINQAALEDKASTDTSLADKASAADSLAAEKSDINIYSQTVKELLNSLCKAVKPEEFKALLKDTVYKKLISQAINDTMKLTPLDVSKEDTISNFYKRVRETLNNLNDEVIKKEPDSALLKNLNSMKNNIDFMNEINHNLTYIQMPLKMSNSETNGELYVFTNKKFLSNKNEELSALLHLDMDNLGPMNIYLKLKGMNLSADFCLSGEDVLNFLSEHIDELNEHLSKKGYKTNFQIRDTALDTNINSDPMNQLLSNNNLNIKCSQYFFDTRA